MNKIWCAYRKERGFVTDRRTIPGDSAEKAMRSVRFFNLYFSSFGKLLLSNLMFLPFNILAAGYIFLVYNLLGGINFAAAAPAFVFLNAGMAGVSLVCRYICDEKETGVFGAFMKGIRENILRFVVHGVVFAVVFAVSSLSIALYYGGTKTSGVFWIPLAITTLISLGVLFAAYYLNIMTVTMDISLKDTYRNCFFFSFGEIKNNLKATAALVILSAVVFSISYIINDMWVVLGLLVVLEAFVLPSTVQFIITFYVYDDMLARLDETRQTQKNDQDSDTDKPEQPILNREEAEEISELASNAKDEYIFYNGRMIQRSAVEKILENDMDDLF